MKLRNISLADGSLIGETFVISSGFRGGETVVVPDFDDGARCSLVATEDELLYEVQNGALWSATDREFTIR